MTGAGREKKPWFPWFPRDFSTDERVLLMDLETECCYRRLLDHQWLHRSVPADLPSLAKICKGISKAKMRRIWATLEPLFPSVSNDGQRRQNRRLERIRAKQDERQERRRESAKAAADARWARDRGGNASGTAADHATAPPDAMRPASVGNAIPETDPETEPEPEAVASAGLPAVHDPVMRCTIAANRGLRANPAIGRAFNELASSNQTGVVGGWMLKGVDPALAERVVYDKAVAYVPKGRNRQPQSLAYFTSAVLDAHDAEVDRKAQLAAQREIDEAERRKREARRPPPPEPPRDPDAPLPDWRALLDRTTASVDPSNPNNAPHPAQSEDERRQAVKQAAADARRQAERSTP